MTTPYSPLKALRHTDRIDKLRNGEQPAPIHIQLIISDLCNQDCSFCSHRTSGYTTNQLFVVTKPDGSVNHNPNRMIPYDKVVEILDDCAAMGVKAIQVTGGGEPTVHPQHEQIFRDVLERGLELAVVSNGVKLSDDAIESLLEAKWVRFSLDAGKAKTYASIRGVSPETFERACGNIRKLVERKQDTGSQVRIGMGFVVTKENYSEILAATEIAKLIEVDNFRISGVFQNDGARYFDAFYDDADEQARAAEKLGNEVFSVYNLFSNRVYNLAEANPEYKQCCYQQVTTYIGGDLNVYRCCNTSYSEQGLLGSLKQQRFADLWESQAKRAAIENFDARGCVRCMFNAQNRAILYAIDPAPADVNFV